MKVFMLGWEFPPYISGGLGTACYGLTKGLDAVGVQVTFVLPTPVPVDVSSHVTVRTPADARKGGGGGGLSPEMSAALQEFKHLQVKQIPAEFQAYSTPATFREAVIELIRQGKTPAEAFKAIGVEQGLSEEQLTAEAARGAGLVVTGPPAGSNVDQTGAGAHYQGDLMEQVRRYASLATQIAMRETFDLVHAHDWMTYAAGLAVSSVSGRPLVVHVHSTEFDRSGENVNQQVYDIERAGIHGADRVICVSNFTRNIVINRYGAEPEKVSVVYNAVAPAGSGNGTVQATLSSQDKIVLFLGRITMQKGPEYFLAAAKKVLEKMPNVKFVMAGSGDMIRRTIEMAASMGIGQKVAFTGFLRGADVDRVFEMADLYVMPSVSEPFGIAPLEALSHNVPVIISKQSGVSEVLTHALKVDFWDINEMANKILAVLRHPPLHRVLREQGSFELRKFSWSDSAARCKEIYESLVA
ncbi:MAG: glycosyltransferase family 4 protein [Planctomycetes bacterium]|nr:glycosyltransferase family 4 protein [Planctomycetota bacterium]